MDGRRNQHFVWRGDGRHTDFGGRGSFPPNFINVRSGEFAAFALVAHAEGERITLTQTVPVASNQLMEVGFYLGNDSASDFGMVIPDPFRTDIFVDGVRVLKFPSGDPPPPIIIIGRGSDPDSFVRFFGTFDTGSRTSVTVTFTITGSGESRVGVSLDDFFLAPVPEPGALCLLGAGLVGALTLLRRRRR